tara:strand:- start:143 stop:406 length:264 start_codon:yes stop_codon:yes gene_type:complete
LTALFDEHREKDEGEKDESEKEESETHSVDWVLLETEFVAERCLFSQYYEYHKEVYMIALSGTRLFSLRCGLIPVYRYSSCVMGREG